MKKNIPLLMTSAMIMLVLPWLTVTFVKGDGGMAVCFILFFALNPVYAICTGVYAGRDIKTFWWTPIATAVFFLVGVWLLFDPGETEFVLYSVVYLLLGIVAMLISGFVRNRH